MAIPIDPRARASALRGPAPVAGNTGIVPPHMRMGGGLPPSAAAPLPGSVTPNIPMGSMPPPAGAGMMQQPPMQMPPSPISPAPMAGSPLAPRMRPGPMTGPAPAYPGVVPPVRY